MAMDTRAEELLLTIETTLYKVTETKLKETADYLKVSDTEGLSKRALIRTIHEHLDGLCEAEKDYTEDLHTSLEDILAFLCGTPPSLEKTSDEDKELLERAKEEYNEMQKDFLKMMTEHEQKMNEVKARMQRFSGQADEKQQSNPTPLPNVSVGHSENGRPIVIEDREVPLRNVFRFRDFKVHGVISDGKDRISYTNLSKQIESALSKGYEENEIVDAIINAVSPNLHLRSYLESIRNLSLSEVRQILRSHYREKSATEAYQELTNMVQEPSESPLDFLMRALKLRQHILLASQESDSKIRYDQSLLQNVFLNALETGLANETIRNRMRPIFQSPAVTDEFLIREMNTAVTAESERISKFVARKRSVKTAQTAPIAVSDTPQETTPSKPKEQNASKPNPLIVSLDEVKADIAMIKQSINVSSENKNMSRRSNRSQSACEDCINKQRREQCDHCFICGSAEHYARGCRKRKPRGNRGQLHVRDKV